MQKNKFDSDLGILLIDIGDIYRKREKHDTAIEFYNKSIMNLENTVGKSNLDIVDAYYSKSLSLISKSDLGSAEKYLKGLDSFFSNCLLTFFKKECQTILKKYDHFHYKNGLVLSTLGQLYSMKSQYSQAFKYLTDGGNVLIKTLGEGHLEVADVYLKIGECALKEIDEQRKSSIEKKELLNFLEKCLEIYKNKFNENHKKVTETQTFIFLLTQSIN